MSEFIDINDNMAINVSHIKGISNGENGKTKVYVNLSGKNEVLDCDMPYEVLRFVVKSKSGNSERYLKQLAENNQMYRG